MLNRYPATFMLGEGYPELKNAQIVIGILGDRVSIGVNQEDNASLRVISKDSTAEELFAALKAVMEEVALKKSEKA